ncbi:hypothetical protein Halha_1647 [Halobacteroides halobius DSM 5150]|uniref:DUF4387 domain-containing protein n=1 Tax=Halobacteroides halobius (strain ATCC 35273 / DSM 5150 / MD-1) TaxID=748449 RepID=L0KAL2_HALHC|nr:DUF4387 domain-containing protein [Halobacteroides halobius]AGB41585.1 hypothetical protein Halha_1647 [Halobacteroides halobius DSM 5150]
MTEKRNIKELVDVIRSKNAGPYELTFDLIFKDFKTYEAVKSSGVINKSLIAKLYDIDENKVISVINYDPAKAIKATIERPCSAGAIGETDVYGAQQHAPLLSLKILM